MTNFKSKMVKQGNISDGNLHKLISNTTNASIIGEQIQTAVLDSRYIKISSEANLDLSTTHLISNPRITESQSSNIFYPKNLTSAGVTLNESIGGIQSLAVNTGRLMVQPSNNFIGDPIGTSLGVALNAVGSHVSLVTNSVQNNSNLIAGMATIQDSTNILKLNNYALDLLNQPNIISTIPEREKHDVTDQLHKMNNKIKDLEEKLAETKAERKDKEISEITNKVRELLEKFGEDIIKMFDGAYQVLLDDLNKERIPHSAESMSRLMESLPEKLCKETSSHKDKASIVVFRLSKFIGISRFEEGKNHDLVKRQHIFYEVFSNIRHRNKNIATYLEDINLYKALLLQAEAYLYELLTLKTLRA